MKMKKMLTVSLVVSSLLQASSVNIYSGWNLVGAVTDVNPTTINCAKTIWSFDPLNQSNPWSLYQNVDTSHNFGFNNLSNIEKGKGFWIYSNCNTPLNFLDGTVPDDQNMIFDINASQSSLLSFSTLTDAFTFENRNEDHDYFSKINISGQNISVEDYELKNQQWILDDQFGGTFTINDEQNISLVMDDGLEADLVLTDTKKVNSLGGTVYDDLYISDIEFHITRVGSPWADTWDWAPRYWDQTTQQEVNVTTNTQLLNMFLLQNNWFGADYAMLSGSTSDITGNIVSGNFVGYCDMNNDGVLDQECKMVERTTNVIGSWSFDTQNGITVDLPNEIETISVIQDSTSPTGYFVYSQGNDKVGSVWHEQMFTGSDASVGLMQNLLNNY